MDVTIVINVPTRASLVVGTKGLLFLLTHFNNKSKLQDIFPIFTSNIIYTMFREKYLHACFILNEVVRTSWSEPPLRYGGQEWNASNK